MAELARPMTGLRKAESATVSVAASDASTETSVLSRPPRSS
jgi:hypothetical protein